MQFFYNAYLCGNDHQASELVMEVNGMLQQARLTGFACIKTAAQMESCHNGEPFLQEVINNMRELTPGEDGPSVEPGLLTLIIYYVNRDGRGAERRPIISRFRRVGRRLVIRGGTSEGYVVDRFVSRIARASAGESFAAQLDAFGLHIEQDRRIYDGEQAISPARDNTIPAMRPPANANDAVTYDAPEVPTTQKYVNTFMCHNATGALGLIHRINQRLQESGVAGFALLKSREQLMWLSARDGTPLGEIPSSLPTPSCIVALVMFLPVPAPSVVPTITAEWRDARDSLRSGGSSPVGVRVAQIFNDLADRAINLSREGQLNIFMLIDATGGFVRNGIVGEDATPRAVIAPASLESVAPTIATTRPSLQRLSEQLDTLRPLPTIDWGNHTTWECASEEGGTTVCTIIDMSARHAWETITWLYDNRYPFFYKFTKLHNLRYIDGPPINTEEIWLSKQPAFRALVQQAVRQHVTFPPVLFQYLNTYLLGEHADADIPLPWDNPEDRQPQSGLGTFLESPVQVTTNLEMHGRFGRNARELDLS